MNLKKIAIGVLTVALVSALLLFPNNRPPSASPPDHAAGATSPAADQPAVPAPPSPSPGSTFTPPPPTVTPAGLLDFAESYPTPDGPRPLHRFPGRVALKLLDPSPAARATSLASLTSPGAPLAAYTVARSWPNGVIELHAPPATIAAHRDNPSALTDLLDDLRTGHAAQLELANPVHADPDTGESLVTFGDLIICLNPGHTDPATLGLTTTAIRPLRGTSDQFIATLASPDANHLLAESNRLASDPRVAWSEPDFIIEINPAFTPNDPLFSDQWHLENNRQAGGVKDADVDATTAWNTTLGSQDIIVAVIDDGFDMTHDDLRSNIHLNPGELGEDASGNPKLANDVDDDGNGYEDDLNGWNFYEDNNDPGALSENPYTTKTTLPGNPAPASIPLSILQTSGDPAESFGYAFGSPGVVIAKKLGGFLESDQLRFYIYNNDGTADDRPTVRLARGEGNIPDSASTYFDRLVTLAEPYFEEGKAFFGSEDEAEEMKLLFSAIFGQPYRIPAHGTAVAGVAVARGNNSTGVAGVAPLCKLLPLKVGFTGSRFAETVHYAAGFKTPGFRSLGATAPRRGADVINMSLSSGSSSAVSTAFERAANHGRDGRGCLIFGSSANDASGWIEVEVGFGSIADLFSGNLNRPRTFRWVYTKDGSSTAGDDAVWIDDVIVVPSQAGLLERFNDGEAQNFTTSPADSWTIANDSARAKGTGGNGSMKTATLAAGSSATLSRTVTSPPGAIAFSVWVSCHSSDKFEFFVDDQLMFSLSGSPSSSSDLDDSITLTTNPTFASLVDVSIKSAPVRSFPAFPARNQHVIGVGGSTTFDTRVAYSQYGTLADGLDLVTPTGFPAGNIFTTDVSLSPGYDKGDYTGSFNGTSSSAPLAAGIGALLLSVNPDLDSATARRLLHSACDKIGPDPYTDDGSGLTRNEFYGYGKLNAAKAVQAGLTSYGDVAPSNVTASVDGITTTITWDYPYTQTSAILHFNDQPTIDGAANYGVSSDTTKAQDFTTAVGSRFYAVQILGPLDGQQSKLSDWIEVVRPVPTPKLFRASKGAFFDKVVVSWLPVQGADDYLLTRSKNLGPDETIPLAGTSFTDADVAPGDSVIYSLVARANLIESARTEPTTGFVGTPVDVSATQGTRAGSIRISWDPPPYARTGYVYRTTTTSPPPDDDNDGTPDIPPLNPNRRVAGAFTDTTALDGTPYYYWIAGRTSDGTLTTPSGPALGFTAPSPQFEPGGTSDDPDGPTFRWIDISQTGTEVLSTGDDSSTVVDVGLFPFFGDTFFEMSVSSNGYLSTDPTDSGSDWDNDCPIPTPPSSGGGARLYPYHDDLDLRAFGASVFVQRFDYAAHSYQPTPPDRFRDSITVVQWNNVVRLGEDDPFSFQAILFSNGDVIYQYLPGNPGGGSASVGLQNTNGDQGISVSCNQTGTIPTDRPFAVLLLAPPPTIWVPDTEAFVTTDTDEWDGALGMGTGDSLREIHLLTGATTIRFDPSLAGKTITIQDGSGFSGGPLSIGGRTVDGRDAPGLTISGGGTIRPFSPTSLTFMDFRNLTIADSFSEDNGGLFNTSQTIFLENVTIRDCLSHQDGGVLYTFETSTRSPYVVMRNCTFINNYALDEGGALYLQDISNFTIVNCTFANNRADEGGAVYFDNASGGYVRNNIFAYNRTTINDTRDVSGLTLTNNQGNNLFTVATGATLRPTDIVADPRLLPPALNGGNVPVRGLRQDSPAIDAGDNTATFADAHGTRRNLDGDLDGTPRPDIGAFEAPQPNIVVTTTADTTDPADGQLSLREAVTLADIQPGARIGFDSLRMGSPTVTLDGSAPLVLGAGNSVEIRGSAAGLVADGNLLGFWRFDHRNGNTIPNQAALTGDLELLPPTSLTTTDSRPGFGTSARITRDKTTGAVAENPRALAPRDQITVAAWVRPDAFAGLGGIAGLYDGSSGNPSGYSLRVLFPDEFGWQIKTENSGGFVGIRSNRNFATGQWYFVVGTYDGQEARLYVNGVLEAAAPATGAIDYDPFPAAGFQVGRDVGPNFTFAMDGLIDDVMVFDSAVSSAEATDLVGIAPPGGITVDAAGAPHAFRVAGSTTALFENLNLTGATESGLVVDGNATATLDHCTVADNISPHGGGGIRNYGITALNRSVVRDNTATGAWGGGIDNVFGGRLTLNFSTVHDNTALAGNGGGIDTFSDATLVLNQSTVSGNTASGQGGGIYVHSSNAQIAHSTVADNTANSAGDGLRINSGTVTASHSLFADNGDGPDVVGTLTSLGHNLVADASSTSGLTASDIADTDARITPFLIPAAGATSTHALLPGSPAVEAGLERPGRDILQPGDAVTAGPANNSPPSAAPALAFDDDPATVYRSFDSNLIAFWDFDTPATGGNANDRVADRPGTFQDNATIGTPGSGRSGTPGDRALATPGEDDGLVVADASFLNTTANSDTVTIALWQKIDGPLDIGIPFFATSLTGEEGFGLAVGTPAQGSIAIFATRAQDNDDALFLTSDTLTDVDWTAWTHVAVVKNGFQREIYINGDRVAIGTGAEPLVEDFGELRIGFGAIGRLDDLAVYASALTPAQIATLASSGPQPGSAEFTVTPTAGLATVNALELTSTPGSPAADPVSFRLEGSLDNRRFTTLAEGPVPPFAGRSTTQTIPFNPSGAFSHFRLSLLAAANPSQTSAIEIAEVALLDRPTTDQRGRPRLADGDGKRTRPADIGAFELQGYVVGSELDGDLAEFDPDSLAPGQLRSAIQSANPADVVFFDAVDMRNSTISLDPAKGPLKVSNRLAIVTTNVIDGHVTIDGGDATAGLIEIAPGASLAADGLTLTRSAAPAITNHGVLALSNSTIYDNHLTGLDGAALDNHGSALLVNTTVSNNSTTSARGGGIINRSRLDLEHSTITTNTANAGGGIYILPTATHTAFTHTVVSENTASTSAPDISGTFSSSGYNHIGSLIGNTGSAATDTSGPAFLSPLRDNGGPTLTHSPTQRSPLLDTGDPALNTTLTTDQRRFNRIVGTRIDRGALEHDPRFLRTGEDSDADSLPDTYELFYGLNPFDASDATADSDGDGLNAAVEFASRSEPDVPLNNLEDTVVVILPNDKIRVAWSSTPYVTYSVWTSGDLLSFKPIPGSTVLASSAVSTIVFDRPPTNPTYFQVRIGPAPEDIIRSAD